MMENSTNARGPNDVGPTKRFHDSSHNQKGRVSFQADGTNQVPAFLIGKKTNENDSPNERRRMRAKVASCPSNQIKPFTNNHDGNLRQEKMAANRRRAQSMPAGSLASQDFFRTNATTVKDKTSIDVGETHRLKMEQICENHSSRDDKKPCHQKQPELDHETAPNKGMEAAKLCSKQADAGKPDDAHTEDFFQLGPSNQSVQKCNCIIL